MLTRTTDLSKFQSVAYWIMLNW